MTIKAIPDYKEKIDGKKYFELLYSREEIIPDSGTKGLLGYIIDEILKSGETQDYKGAIVEFIKSLMLNKLYLNGIIPENKTDRDKMNDDYGISKIIHAFSFASEMGGLEATLEAKAGLGFGGSITAGELATVGIGLETLAEVTYQGVLYEDGALTDVGGGLLGEIGRAHV